MNKLCLILKKQIMKKLKYVELKHKSINSIFRFIKIIAGNLERQIQDLREKLSSNEGSVSESIRSRLIALETKNHAYEEQLDNEVRYVINIFLFI